MERIQYLLGDKSVVENDDFDFGRNLLLPYSDIVCDFLNEVSKTIMHTKEWKRFPDVTALAYWCRRANLIRMKEAFMRGDCRIGRGMAFHIAPSNVPVNTFYTLFWGLLSGCYNIVKAPSRESGQIESVCRIIQEVLEKGFGELIPYINVIRYSRESSWTQYLSDKCMARIVWGGDETIRLVTQTGLRPRAVELKFADRYSLAVISTESIRDIPDTQLKQLAHHFYNDTYLMDQNACSSPHLICWMSKKGEAQAQAAKDRFWEAVYQESCRYELEEIKSSEKYTVFCDLVMTNEMISTTKRYGNRVYVMTLSQVPNTIESLRGKYGLFFEYETNEVAEVFEKLSEKTQTCLYYGVRPEELVNAILSGGALCIDRVVPVGEALSIGSVWDGYDVISELSRIITVV